MFEGKGKMSIKPRVFIGSSYEGKKIAENIHLNLFKGKHYEPIIWTAGVFQPGMSNLEGLFQQLKEADFAVLVMSPDDLLTTQSTTKRVPRDNVLFELGLFMGKLGRFRAICVIQEGDDIYKLSDLDGISVIRYPNNISDYQTGLVATCTEIQNCLDKEWNKKEVPQVLVASKNVSSQVISWDCTPTEFVEHLKQAKTVHIVGITNENLADHLKLAFEAKHETPWIALEIIFISKRLMPLYKKTNENETAAVQRWEKGVATIRAFCFSAKRKARMVSVRYMDSIIPFIGQVYDGSYVRVSFVLPFSDLKQSCYINYQAKYPPCHYQKKTVSAFCSGNTEEAPPCKREGKESFNCDNCWWKRFSCQSLLETIMEIKNHSTPLFAANVVGSTSIKDKKTKFHFETLIPQQGWRDYRSKLNRNPNKPVHLCSFILLYTRDYIILQRRTAQNSSGEDTHNFSLVAEKISDEDFLDAPSACYREKVQFLQEEMLTNDDLSSSFIEELEQTGQLKIIKGGIVPDVVLIEVCKRASVKGLMEKLGLFKTINDLKSGSNSNSHTIKFDLIVHNHYNLYGTIFGVKLHNIEIQNIEWNRPTAELKYYTLKGFEDFLSSENNVGHYLQQHSDKILDLAKSLIENQF